MLLNNWNKFTYLFIYSISVNWFGAILALINRILIGSLHYTHCKKRFWVLSPSSSHPVTSTLKLLRSSEFVICVSCTICSTSCNHYSGNSSFSFKHKLRSVQQATAICSTLHVAASSCLDRRRNLPFNCPKACSMIIRFELWAKLNLAWTGLRFVPAYGVSNHGSLDRHCPQELPQVHHDMFYWGTLKHKTYQTTFS